MSQSEKQPSLRLVGTDGSRYYAFDLTPGRYIIGREETNDFAIQNKTVSRKHAEIELLESGNYYLTDLSSHNGTTVNGIRIAEKTEIRVGSTITFGQLEFRLTESNDSSAVSSRPTVTRFTAAEPEKSVFLSIKDALAPLPPKVADHPDLFPTLSEMARMLVLGEPKEQMLSRALELVSRVIPAERLAVLFTVDNDENDNEIYTAATLLPSGKDPGDFTLSRTIVNDILTKKQAILVGDMSQNSRLADQKSIVAMHLKSAMAVPLFDEGEVLGILYVDSTSPVHRYSDEYLRLLAMFGNVIASRLVNYTLLHEREEKKIIDAELDRASGIQQHLLHKECPTLEGYNIHALQEQCRAVGGDLYDVAKLSDGRLLFLVADVSGKGLGAALLMSNILASFRILYSQPEFNILRVVEAVSSQLYSSSTPGDFATLFVGIIDPVSQKVNYVNAGHNSPFLVRADGSVESMDASGTMIGAFDAMTWTESDFSMRPGDIFCVYSDGVTEAERVTDEQYGEERLKEQIIANKSGGAKEIAAAIKSDIERFVEDAPQSDDVTILVIKRES